MDSSASSCHLLAVAVSVAASFPVAFVAASTLAASWPASSAVVAAAAAGRLVAVVAAAAFAAASADACDSSWLVDWLAADSSYPAESSDPDHPFDLGGPGSSKAG